MREKLPGGEALLGVTDVKHQEANNYSQQQRDRVDAVGWSNGEAKVLSAQSQGTKCVGTVDWYQFCGNSQPRSSPRHKSVCVTHLGLE